MMKRLTVAIATESEIEAAGIRTLLSSIKDFHPEPVHVPAPELLTYAMKQKPAAIIADICDPTAVSQIKLLRRESDTPPAIIGLSHTTLPPGVTGCVDAVLSIYDGALTLNETLNRLVTLSSESVPTDLTPREREVIKGIVKGLSNKEIASEINVSVNTVMTHRRNIASKLRIHSSAGLTIYAIVSKLVSLDEVKGTVGIND